MANCSKCGAEISSDQQICAACGTPAAAAPAAYAAPIAAAPVKSGPSALKIILIIVAVIVGLGVLGVGALGYLGYKAMQSVQVSKNGENLTASDLGVDIYPGAEQAKGSMKMNFAGTSTVIGKFATSDSKDAVFAFYKDKLGPDATSVSFAGSTSLSAKKGDQESVVVTIMPNPSQADGKTLISIQHTKKS